MAEIQLNNIVKTYGKVRATDDISLTTKDREFMVLLGPSGCGKTTLLRAIAGLDQPDSGSVLIGGKDVTFEPPRKRNIAMVFQSYAVFPHLSVYDNIAFGLQMKHMAKDEIAKRVKSSAELLRIQDYLDRFPAQLSGGQRQRVAVARALAMPSEVLLMDEPLSNLDALLRLDMRAELKRLCHDVNATTVYVTHDQVEALSLGDRIAVMKNGKILQCDSPLVVYDNPADMFVGGFIGNPPMNFISGGRMEAAGYPAPKNGRLMAGIRAENIEPHTQAATGALESRVVVVEPLGSHNLITARVGDEIVKVSAHPDMRIDHDQTIWLKPEPRKIRWMDAETGKAI
ncbi:MAG TPA: ABC transporter ATP-binding protein [Thermoflexales bacterium]|nr:ABC transporter ATP-binding protein [Thermoflexales bacterium]HQW36566.1 ABC transporter ATP-binding protein [Thermoflexales bacterium]HQX74829.1 ABC transporter ATP-binding protein [Thermoflexales bacterium]HQZ22580.1 ABC transporter ATP-binding protein [Thermoflexales bacterium]HQZ98997.1 ABC transporter ATP-binding protein [Thermoflexales bacterium]